MTAIGKMRKRVGIYSRADTEAGTSSSLLTRTLVAEVWAQIINITGTQQIDSRNAGAGVSHRITIRDRSDVSKVNEIKYDGKWYTIATVQRADDERERFLVLECLQLDTDGALDSQSPEAAE